MHTLITGANGFFGRYLIQAGAQQSLITLGMDQCDINCNLAESIPVLPAGIQTVIHAAGKAHVIPTDKAGSDAFFKVNLQGTKNLIAALEQAGSLPAFFVFISTVAVYGCENGEQIPESEALSGNTPYALSKKEAEEWLISWGNRNNVSVLILRLPLLAGKNPPGNLGHMLSAMHSGFYFSIGQNEARRSMVLASDVAEFIFSLTQANGIYNLSDGHHPSVYELETALCRQIGKKIRRIPMVLAKIAARAGDFLPIMPINSHRLGKLTQSLTFSDAKARKELGWNPRPVLNHIDEIV